MGSRRRIVPVLGLLTVLAVAGFSVTVALAQEDGAPSGTDDASLLERLDALEDVLPATPPPSDVTVTANETGGQLSADGASTRAVLDTIEADLRRLFVDADDADGEVADAVAMIAMGWLDLWQGSAHLQAAETNDLAFPIETFDAEGVATGADELRGEVETGLALVLQGRDRLHRGYGTLRALQPADDLAVQVRFDARAAAEEDFDTDLRPLVHRLLSLPATTVVASTDRFRSEAPGVDARARSMTITCVDREALDAAGGVASDELLAELAADRIDCPDLPDGVLVTESD